MKPDNTPLSSSTSSPQSGGLSPVARESAVNLIRQQLDELYAKPEQQSADKKTDTTPPSQVAEASQSPAPAIDREQWAQYHSAWQEYYQKYYQQYYTGYAYKVIQAHTSKTPAQPEEPATPAEKKKEELSKLRSRLVEKARTSAHQARGSRHFVPIAAAMCVVMIFAFLQYNSVLMGNVQAYISPGAIDPQNIVIDPNTDVAVSPEPKLIIPKINVNVPVVYGVGAGDKEQLAAMQHGVAHWPGGDQAKSVPGQAGNTVIAGHSSNDLFEGGDYKFVFAQLERLQQGDTIYANYEGKRYTYTVTRKDIILPKGQWQSIITPTDKPMLVLVTCWPLGTAQKRLLVTAEQISPDPAAVKPAPAASETVETTDSMTGTSPTFLEWLMGLFGFSNSNR